MILKILISIIGLLILGLLSFFLWARVTPLSPQNFEGEMKSLELKASINKDQESLKVLSWNMAFAHGLYSEGGENYQPKEQLHFDQTLKAMGKLVKESEADIVFLQEIDFGSKRTYFQDQVQILAKHADMKYVAYAPSWVANHIPFPYLPLSRQFGKLKSGGAIISKYPLQTNQIILHAKPSNSPWWYNAFYLYRYTQMSSIKFNGQIVWLLNNHLEAFDTQNREEQTKTLLALVENLKKADSQSHILIAGDFNTTPSFAIKKHDFDDHTGDDYRDDQTFDLLSNSDFLKSALRIEEHQRLANSFFTFPAHNPNRQLDYFFASKNIHFQEFKIINDQNSLSDHLPVFAEVKLSE